MACIAIAAGHTAHPDDTESHRGEWERCRAAQEILHDLLAKAGHQVVVPAQAVYELPAPTSLKTRVQRFNAAKADLAVELHLNAGGGRYSTVLYWDAGGTGKASLLGRAAASRVTQMFSAGLPWKTIGARPQSYFGRSLYFLNRTTMTSIILEPGFKDNATHSALFASSEGVARYAALTFAGLSRYLFSVFQDAR